jgi:hypothetical protein
VRGEAGHAGGAEDDRVAFGRPAGWVFGRHDSRLSDAGVMAHRPIWLVGSGGRKVQCLEAAAGWGVSS